MTNEFFGVSSVRCAVHFADDRLHGDEVPSQGNEDGRRREKNGKGEKVPLFRRGDEDGVT